MTEGDVDASGWLPPMNGWNPPPPDWSPPPPMVLEPVRLEGRLICLEPLGERHIPGLMRAGASLELWRWTVEWLDTPAKLRAYLAAAERARDDGSQLPFVTVEQGSGEVVGSSRYLNIDRANRRLEIGYTWIVPGHQRRGANLEAKLLQLTHAFETLECRRVEFKTDSQNEQSRNALAGIGATFEGILRNHMISQGGRTRHSAYYSVIDEEWPRVKTSLEERLARHLGPTDP